MGKMTNLVEYCAEPDECAFDQKCVHGYRVESYAVYCHNTEWEEAPRKCRRTWYNGKDVEGCQDEDCPGFKLNPEYKE